MTHSTLVRATFALVLVVHVFFTNPRAIAELGAASDDAPGRVMVKNDSKTAIEIRCNSCVDANGKTTHKGESWEFAPGKAGFLSVANKRIDVRSIELSVVTKDGSSTWPLSKRNGEDQHGNRFIAFVFNDKVMRAHLEEIKSNKVAAASTTKKHKRAVAFINATTTENNLQHRLVTVVLEDGTEVRGPNGVYTLAKARTIKDAQLFIPMKAVTFELQSSKGIAVLTREFPTRSELVSFIDITDDVIRKAKWETKAADKTRNRVEVSRPIERRASFVNVTTTGETVRVEVIAIISDDGKVIPTPHWSGFNVPPTRTADDIISGPVAARALTCRIYSGNEYSLCTTDDSDRDADGNIAITIDDEAMRTVRKLIAIASTNPEDEKLRRMGKLLADGAKLAAPAFKTTRSSTNTGRSSTYLSNGQVWREYTSGHSTWTFPPNGKPIETYRP